MFYGWAEATEFGVNGLYFILLYYIVASLLFNRKNDKILISGILIIVYIYTIMLYSLSDTSYLWDYSSIYRVLFGMLNGVLYIPFLIFCFAVDSTSFIIRKIKERKLSKEKVIENENDLDNLENGKVINKKEIFETI